MHRISATPRTAWLDDVLSLKARKTIDPRGRLLLEGLRANEAAFGAGAAFERVIFAPEFFGDAPCARLLARFAREGVPAARLAPALFSRLSYKAEGVIGVVRHRPAGVEAVLATSPVVVLDALSDPGNIGAVVRTANAWGASVAVVEAADKLYHPKSLRASMGALFRTPTCTLDRATLLARVRELGRPLVALTPDGETRVDDLGLGGEVVVVFGNERRGVHPLWLEAATARVAIPMCGIVDSLNVATAAAVVLWEAFRRRGGRARGASMP